MEMTDKEKAKEISYVNARQYRHNSRIFGDELVLSDKECMQSALDMAEWKNKQFRQIVLELIKQSALKMAELKDPQFKEVLEKMTAELFSQKYLSDFELEIIESGDFMLDEIINKLF